MLTHLVLDRVIFNNVSRFCSGLLQLNSQVTNSNLTQKMGADYCEVYRHSSFSTHIPSPCTNLWNIDLTLFFILFYSPICFSAQKKKNLSAGLTTLVS